MRPADTAEACDLQRRIDELEREVDANRLLRDAIHTIVGGTATTSGDRFFRALAQYLAQTFRVRFACVSELVEPERGELSLLAAWCDGAPDERTRTPIVGTPCEVVMRDGHLVCHDGVCDQFPSASGLQFLDARSYLGVAMHDSKGRVLGRVCLIDDGACEAPDAALSVVQIFAARAANELERLRAEEALRASEWKYRTLVESSPYCIKLMDREGRLLSMNKAGLEMVGESDEASIVGRHYLRVVREEDLAWISGLLDQALSGTASEFEFLSAFNTYFQSNFAPIFEPDGTVTKLLSITQDVTARKREETLQQMLINELDHRVKNNLTAVIGLMEQTMRTAGSLEDFRGTFEGRIRALARSHEALAATRWTGVRLHDLLRMAVEPLDAGTPPRVMIEGESALLTPRASGPLALAIHEIAANATEHGSLSTGSGRVSIRSTLDDGLLRVVWDETDGPSLSGPVEPGVGLSLVRGFIVHELGGAMEIEGTGDGVRVAFSIPVSGQEDESVRGPDGRRCNC